jgi:hypothetical protein
MKSQDDLPGPWNNSERRQVFDLLLTAAAPLTAIGVSVAVAFSNGDYAPADRGSAGQSLGSQFARDYSIADPATRAQLDPSEFFSGEVTLAGKQHQWVVARPPARQRLKARAAVIPTRIQLAATLTAARRASRNGDSHDSQSGHDGEGGQDSGHGDHGNH